MSRYLYIIGAILFIIFVLFVYNFFWEILFIGFCCWCLYKIMPTILRACRFRIYVMGRSGHGKSSLINALAGRQVAVTDPVEPQMPQSVPYRIKLPRGSLCCDLLDSRGIFESAPPEGAISADTIKLIKSDLISWNPDLIIHVLAAPDLRNSEQDLKVIREISKLSEVAIGAKSPILLVLTMVDILGNPKEWPPELFIENASLIEEELDYASTEVLQFAAQDIVDGIRYQGLKSVDPSSLYSAIVPVCALEEDLWNIETLRTSIGVALPTTPIHSLVETLRQAMKTAGIDMVETFRQMINSAKNNQNLLRALESYEQFFREFWAKTMRYLSRGS